MTPYPLIDTRERRLTTSDKWSPRWTIAAVTLTSAALWALIIWAVM